MGMEYELKFAADGQTQEAIQRSLGGVWLECRMETTYYDTPDGSLSARRWMLRRRMENNVSVCTLKTPGDGNVRGEWEACAETIEAGIERLCKLDTPAELAALTKAGVVPVCGAAFIRLAAELEAGSDTRVEIALDRGRLFAGDRQAPLCEVELELKRGDPAALETLAREIAEAYSLSPLADSKFKRALALRKDEDNGAF